MAASRRPDRPLLAARRADSWDACCHRAAGSGFEREGISPPDTAPFRHSGEQAGHECESGKRGHAKRVGCDRAVVLFRSASTPVVPSNALTYAARGLRQPPHDTLCRRTTGPTATDFPREFSTEPGPCGLGEARFSVFRAPLRARRTCDSPRKTRCFPRCGKNRRALAKTGRFRRKPFDVFTLEGNSCYVVASFATQNINTRSTTPCNSLLV